LICSTCILQSKYHRNPLKETNKSGWTKIQPMEWTASQNSCRHVCTLSDRLFLK
jgi:hypothetical protein